MNLNPERDERVDPELDALSWNPTAEEADAYLRGHGVIKKCEHCGQDATLTNNFVSHLLARFSERMKEADNAATATRDLCVAKVKSLPDDRRDDRRPPLSAESFKRLVIETLESLTLDQVEQEK